MRKNNLHIFNSNLNNKLKLIPLKTKINDTGKIRYLPSTSKEWKNIIYSYYNKNMQNFGTNNINANKIIKSYFNLYFKDQNFISSKFLAKNRQRDFLRKIYVSSLETKHINSKIIMTFYTLNWGRVKLLKNYTKFLNFSTFKIIKMWRLRLRNKINLFMSKDLEKKDLMYKEYKKTGKDLFVYKYKLLSESLKWYNLYMKLYLTRVMKFKFFEELKYLRKSEFNFRLNNSKFDTFLPKLGNMLSKIYKNNIEFNIINLKSYSLHSDIFTEILTSKIDKKNMLPNFVLKDAIKDVDLAKANHVEEKSFYMKSKDSSLIENKYKNLSLLSIINSKEVINNTCSLNKLLKEITNYTSESLGKYNEDYSNISDMIFNSIKYKNLGGMRIEVKGRLSKRYRADRSVFKMKWKGSLKDIDSSYKNLPTKVYRGVRKPNILYSLSPSKRRVGAFALRGWLSAK